MSAKCLSPSPLDICKRVWLVFGMKGPAGSGGSTKSKIRMHAPLLQGSPAHLLIEGLLEVNEMQVV